MQSAMEDILAPICLQALKALHRHLGYSLRKEYIQIEDSAELWQHLRNSFLSEKIIFLPQARHDSMSLRVLDFPDVSSFNFELHQIVA